MVMRNVHSHKNTTLCEWITLGVSYAPCLIALAIIFGTIYPYWFFFVQETMYLRASSGSPAEGMLYHSSLLGGLFWWGMLLWSYFAAIFTSPGYVDKDPWHHPPQPANANPRHLTAAALEGARNPNIVTETTRSGELRYCTKCKTYKPDNCHHCSECEHCVLGMDHHCPWINNCVGEGNQKMFTLFITYIPLAAIHMVTTVAFSHYVVANTVFKQGKPPDIIHSVFIMIGALAAGVIGVVLGGFAVFQWCLMSQGTSTLERKFGKTRIKIGAAAAAAAAEEGEALVGPGDLSAKSSESFLQKRMRNLRIVMGESLWRWMLPIPAKASGFQSVTSNVIKATHNGKDGVL